MTDDEVLNEFRAAGALLEGHFKLSSGRHSGHYLQCARVLMNAARAERLAAALVERMPQDLVSAIGAVVSPAMGGIIFGHEIGRALGKDAMFVERPTGTFELRRGFALAPGQKVLMVEDVVTTGLSSREAIAAIESAGGSVIGMASLIDRSAGQAVFDMPYFALLKMDFPTFPADDLPPDLAEIPLSKPGSRNA
ncbi:orotate phosphoribosyltransferase [Croceicoccus sp. F390]|uniref:Orotate phosphoribosyltransferase n=1 Tax=Croceicoccus esteveae TaxID=3075597 RepID=A0ABU2ZGA8_9SPHN|nr:orotate phosphoribosyltransferase [Croceicoccus sp. F390]MDT0575256.1 orotate phosphoribosyltransferase [Croceicoccus sp. F390]